ncbi:hypothetical protein PoB_003394200 [Plakobranchus ocellatus]|uniref:Uncharacterized protein n=1 Tax=Plakobranchus ocellatus TaxID=259542 RepID=A0AAV4AKM3_9GAST|nr:hypothetical protein PoB_003394200 [Plakobranchus ocellatus]
MRDYLQRLDRNEALQIFRSRVKCILLLSDWVCHSWSSYTVCHLRKERDESVLHNICCSNTEKWSLGVQQDGLRCPWAIHCGGRKYVAHVSTASHAGARLSCGDKRQIKGLLP